MNRTAFSRLSTSELLASIERNASTIEAFGAARRLGMEKSMRNPLDGFSTSELFAISDVINYHAIAAIAEEEIRIREDENARIRSENKPDKTVAFFEQYFGQLDEFGFEDCEGVIEIAS